MALLILKTKLLIPPTSSECVPRARLVDRLDQWRKRKLTLVSAPAGFGKTTLIASWLHTLTHQPQDQPRTAWLSLEKEDNDSIRFLSHFIAALQTFDPKIGQEAQPLLNTAGRPKITHLMTILINNLAVFQGQGILALDDYHVIKHPELQSAIAFFLDHLPPHFHLILMTREEPALPLPRLRARWETTEIGLNDLRFVGEETEAFLKRTMGLDLTAEAVQTLESCTEGWVAGLQMAALSLRGRATPAASSMTPLEIKAFIGGHRNIIDYLAAEVLKQQTAESREFLRKTAILDRLHASLCDAVTRRDNAQSMLAQLEKANLFLIPLDNERQWYRYHHLFADFLRKETPESEQSVLHGRASQWYEKQGLTSEAIKHALAAQTPIEAVRLIRSKTEETVRNGDFATFREWMNSLPENIVRAHSDMSVWKGWVLGSQGELAAAESYAALAMKNQRPDDPSNQRGLLLCFQAFLALNQGKPSEAVKFAQAALNVLGDAESIHISSALSYLGQGQRLVGGHKAAILTFRKAIAVSQKIGHHLITIEVLYYLSLLLSQKGRLNEAISICEQTIARHLDRQGNPLPAFGMVNFFLGVLYYETNDLKRAGHFLTTGLTACRRLGFINHSLQGQCTLAKLYYALGEIELIWKTLDVARSIAVKSENPRHIRLVDVVTAELQLRMGLTSSAAISLAKLPPLADDRSEQENLAVVRLFLAQKRTQEAHYLLRRLEQNAHALERERSLIVIFTLQALAHSSSGQTEKALESLEQVIVPAALGGYRRLILDESSEIAPLLQQLPHLAPAFVADLLEAFPKTPVRDEPIIDQPEPSHSPTQHPDPSPSLIEPLSKTQRKILRLVAEGLSNRDIADRLKITEGTTKWHLNQIYGKLNVSSRTKAVALARQLSLL
jgi:LuxR family transcriptional regulator, maltose regulon positive regulatory protein